MRYLLSAAGALLLAETVRYITGNLAGLCSLLTVAAFSLLFDKQPRVFLLLACCIWLGVRCAGRYSLYVLNLIPAVALVLLLCMGRSIIAAVVAFMADLIALISLAYRGWRNKRLLD